MVAPNGARLMASDHPALPLTIEQIAQEAEACWAAGAGAIHAHLRDAGGGHLLDAGLYAELVAEIGSRVPQMEVQITTEAFGLYTADQQMKIALSSGATSVSVATREVIGAGEKACRRFFEECAEQSIMVQHILYDLADCAQLQSILGSDQGAAPKRFLFVLGRYDPAGVDQISKLRGFAAWVGDLGWPADWPVDWAVCAFGEQEPHLLCEAWRLGGKCRTGFENSLHLSNGKIAQSNAQKVADLRALLSKMERA